MNNSSNNSNGTQITASKPYILWRRVSTKEQGESGLGLEAQTAIAEYFMHGAPIATYTDVYSGTKLTECAELQRAKEHARRDSVLLVIAKSDRIRNTIDGLTILDEMGEGNVMFCDLGTTDRTVLTMMFAMWERQAIMGRINTRLALQERVKQAQTHGSWISKAGNICTHLGAAKGCDTSAARAASAAAKQARASEWRASSQAVKFAKRWYAEGRTCTEITAELGRLFDDNNRDGVANPYATPSGIKPSKGVVSKWLKEGGELDR